MFGGNQGFGGGNQGFGGGNQGFGGGNHGQMGQFEKSPVFGGDGRNKPHQKYQEMDPNWSLVGVRGRHGASIDQIQFLFVNINTGKFHETGVWGGNGGK